MIRNNTYELCFSILKRIRNEAYHILEVFRYVSKAFNFPQLQKSDRRWHKNVKEQLAWSYNLRRSWMFAA